jgi:GNAT superfamily N-acetyltransferase
MRLFEVVSGERNQDELDTFASELKAKHGLKQLWLYDNGNGIIDLSAITVDKSAQRQGAGTGAMNDLAQYADARGLTIVLIPGVKDTGHGTTSRSRLVKFYKRFGFIENKGNKMDFAIGGGKMVRYPR